MSGWPGDPHGPGVAPQEPGNNAQIKAFAENYGVKFDMYSKIDVNGDDAHPLWKWMKEQPKGREAPWASECGRGSRRDPQPCSQQGGLGSGPGWV